MFVFSYLSDKNFLKTKFRGLVHLRYNPPDPPIKPTIRRDYAVFLRSPDGYFPLKLEVRSVSVNKCKGRGSVQNAWLKVRAEQFIHVQQKGENFSYLKVNMNYCFIEL